MREPPRSQNPGEDVTGDPPPTLRHPGMSCCQTQGLARNIRGPTSPCPVIPQPTTHPCISQSHAPEYAGWLARRVPRCGTPMRPLGSQSRGAQAAWGRLTGVTQIIFPCKLEPLAPSLAPPAIPQSPCPGASQCSKLHWPGPIVTSLAWCGLQDRPWQPYLCRRQKGVWRVTSQATWREADMDSYLERP